MLELGDITLAVDDSKHALIILTENFDHVPEWARTSKENDKVSLNIKGGLVELEVPYTTLRLDSDQEESASEVTAPPPPNESRETDKPKKKSKRSAYKTRLRATAWLPYLKGVLAKHGFTYAEKHDHGGGGNPKIWEFVTDGKRKNLRCTAFTESPKRKSEPARATLNIEPFRKYSDLVDYYAFTYMSKEKVYLVSKSYINVVVDEHVKSVTDKRGEAPVTYTVTPRHLDDIWLRERRKPAHKRILEVLT